jgi:hypothetical protein
MRKRESMRFTKRLTFVLFLTCCLFTQPRPTQAKGIPPQIKKVLSRLKPVIKLVEPLNALLELTGVIDSLDDKIDRIAESKLNAAMEVLKLARLIKDEQRRKEHIRRANQLLVEAEQLETEESRLLLTQYLSGTVYLGQKEIEAATYQFQKVMEHLTGQEALMIDYMERSQGYDFSKEDGWVLSTNCMNQSLALRAYQYYKDIDPISRAYKALKESLIDKLVDKASKSTTTKSSVYLKIAAETLKGDQVKLITKAYISNSKSNESAVILKKKVLDFFKVAETYKAQFEPFLAKCQNCKNRCCAESCVYFKGMHQSFFGAQ